MEVELDNRMMALGVALAASAKDDGKPVSALASETRSRLARLSSRPTVLRFRQQLEKRSETLVA